MPLMTRKSFELTRSSSQQEKKKSFNSTSTSTQSNDVLRIVHM